MLYELGVIRRSCPGELHSLIFTVWGRILLRGEDRAQGSSSGPVPVMDTNLLLDSGQVASLLSLTSPSVDWGQFLPHKGVVWLDVVLVSKHFEIFYRRCFSPGRCCML